jgi:DNA-binding transcriptional regulator WhiA
MQYYFHSAVTECLNKYILYFRIITKISTICFIIESGATYLFFAKKAIIRTLENITRYHQHRLQDGVLANTILSQNDQGKGKRNFAYKMISLCTEKYQHHS